MKKKTLICHSIEMHLLGPPPPLVFIEQNYGLMNFTHAAAVNNNPFCLFIFFKLISLLFSLSFFHVDDHSELLSSWESLLHWSENESVAKQLQEEMAVLVGKLNKIGASCASLDTESAIHLAIEEAQVS